MGRSDLELAAYLGDSEAALSLGVPAAPGAETDFDSWAWQLSAWGQDTMTRAALAAARFALPIWENYPLTGEFEGDALGGSQARELLEAIDAHLAARPEAEADLANAVAKAREMVEQAAHYCDEASGDASVVQRRFRALAALQAALAALETAVWSAAAVQSWAEQYGIDPAEVAAQVETGPALHTVQALKYARLATAASISKMLAELRRALL